MELKIFVCIKQVPDTMEVRINPKTNNLDREGIQSVMNPYDKHAIQEAVNLKKEHGGKVTAITMGPPGANSILREAIAMGADDAFLVSDRAFAGADTLVTSHVLMKAVQNIDKDFDLILCGKQAVDADTGQVGPGMAERLGIAQLTFIDEIITVDDGKITVKRQVENGHEVVETALPALLTVTDKINEVKYPNPLSIMKAARRELGCLCCDDLCFCKSEVGQSGSPTVVSRLYTPTPKSKAVIFEGEAASAVSKLVGELKLKKII